MKYLAILILFTLSIFAGLTSAYEIIEGPKIICELQEDHVPNQIITDGNYVLITEISMNTATTNDVEEFWRTGNMYLYSIANKTLTVIPGNIPSQVAFLTENMIFWKSEISRIPNADEWGNTNTEEYYYQYQIGSETSEKNNYLAEPDIEGFATDGIHLISVTRNYSPWEYLYTLYNLETGKEQRIYPPGQPKPDRTLILSGEYFVYTDDHMLLANPNDAKLRVYNIYTNETLVIGREGYIQSAYCYLWKDTLLYEEWKIGTDRETASKLWTFNLKTNETKLFEVPDELKSAAFYPPYAVWSGMNETTKRIEINLAKLNTPEWEYLPEENFQTAPQAPSQTKSAPPFEMMVGTLAFALSIALAIIWRKT